MTLMPEHENHSGEVAALHEEIAQLRRAVVSHAVVDQAIGVVITYGGLRPEDGWDAIKEISQRTNIKVREVAEHLVRWPAEGSLPPRIRRGLDGVLEFRRPPLPGAGGLLSTCSLPAVQPRKVREGLVPKVSR